MRSEGGGRAYSRKTTLVIEAREHVGAIEQGPAELRGRTVFCLYPHETLWDTAPLIGNRVTVVGAGMAGCPEAADGRDLVMHTSATSAGLQRSLDLFAPEGTAINLSWYGDTEIRLSLGGRSTWAASASARARSSG